MAKDKFYGESNYWMVETTVRGSEVIRCQKEWLKDEAIRW